MRKIILSLIATVLTSHTPIASSGATVVYDLTADWIAPSSSNGQWSWVLIYKNNEGSLVVGSPPPFGASGTTAWATWTAPESGTIDISGAIWDLYEGGGYADWYLDGVIGGIGVGLNLGSIGGTGGTPIPFSDGYIPEPVLQNIPVEAGDQFTLTILAYYAGFEYTIAFTPAAAADPIGALEELQAAVVAMNLQNGIENSLDNKLDAALNALDDLNANNDAAACNSLQAFMNAVEAQRNNQITSAQADQLIASAEEIQVMLNCGT